MKSLSNNNNDDESNNTNNNNNNNNNGWLLEFSLCPQLNNNINNYHDYESDNNHHQSNMIHNYGGASSLQGHDEQNNNGTSTDGFYYSHHPFSLMPLKSDGSLFIPQVVSSTSVTTSAPPKLENFFGIDHHQTMQGSGSGTHHNYLHHQEHHHNQDFPINLHQQQFPIYSPLYNTHPSTAPTVACAPQDKVHQHEHGVPTMGDNNNEVRNWVQRSYMGISNVGVCDTDDDQSGSNGGGGGTCWTI